MNHHLTPDERTALVLGLAAKNEAGLWHAHLSECAECREELELDREMLQTVKAFTPPECPQAQWEHMVHEALDEVRPVALVPQTHERVYQGARMQAWLWRAASLLIVFGLGYHVGTNQATERLTRTEYAESPRWTGHTIAPAVLPRPTPEDQPPTSGSYASRRVLMVKAEDITRRL